jgi:hypothetical protein
MAEFNVNQFEEGFNSSSTGSAMTLREAIILTNNSGEDDVITLAEGTYTLPLERKDDMKMKPELGI